MFQGLYDQALEDCEKTLELNDGNYRVLYRKARSLKEMGRHAEAYDAVAKCSLAVPQVSQAGNAKLIMSSCSQSVCVCVSV